MEGCLSAYREEVMQLKHLDLPYSVVEHRLVLPCKLLSCMTTSPPAKSRNPDAGDDVRMQCRAGWMWERGTDRDAIGKEEVWWDNPPPVFCGF